MDNKKLCHRQSFFYFNLVTDQHFFRCKTFDCAVIPFDVQRLFVLFHHSGHFFAFQFHQDLIVSSYFVFFAAVFVLWASDDQIFFGFNNFYGVELSSFQLDNMYEFRANVAVLMNITPDHLDRYEHKMQNYVDAKFRILQNQQQDDAFVFWNDDPIIQNELPKYKHGKLYPFAERNNGKMAAYTDEEKIIFTEPTPFNMELEELSLTGKHNLYNSMAAGISANVAGIRKETIREALSSFAGVEHRLEKVAKIDGVEYINDSKATNVNSCWYALQSMKTKTVLILGGKDKGNDYSEIADLVKEKCSGLIFLGADNKKLHDFFGSYGLPIADTHSMRECVDAARKMAKSGETVLLSPCCASFDLFKSYEDRGKQFKEIVNTL